MNEIDEVLEIGKTLSSKTRLRIIYVLGRSSLTVNEIMRKYNEEFGNAKYRESIYRQLETLVERDILRKVYDQTDKTLKYELVTRKITLDLEAMDCRRTRHVAGA